MHACTFLFTLLIQMKFHILTGYGISQLSFCNDEGAQLPGQGMLQEDSSAASVYNVNSEVSLATYCHLATGATFIHPITKARTTDYTTQYVDDKTDMINITGLQERNAQESLISTTLLQHAQQNTDTWSKLLWISRGVLNGSKCFYYHINLTFDFNASLVKYQTNMGQPNIQLTSPENNCKTDLECLNVHVARCMLGAMLIPSGDAKVQISTCLQKIDTFSGKLSHCHLPNHLLWRAIKLVLEPGLIYPFVLGR